MNRKINLALCTIVTVFFISCREDDSVGQISNDIIFSFNNQTIGGRFNAEVELTHILVTIENGSGTVVYDDAILLNQFEGEYESNPISLNLGAHELTRFLVVDINEEVHLATPLEGSELAHLVNDPLPIQFVITKDQVTHVVPEVISTEEGTSEDFGYTSMSFNTVNTFDLLIGALAYDYTTAQYELTDANLTITHDSDTIFVNELFAVTNKVTLSERLESFNLIVSKAGYDNFEETFSIDSLMQHDGTTIHGPLEVNLTESANLSDGLVAYYPFSGNANDESSNSNNGVVNGAILTTDRYGTNNSAYSFDGVDDYINVGTSSTLDLGLYDEFTISVWINTPQDNISVGETILGKYDSFQDRRSFSMSYIPSDQVGFTTYEAGTLNDYNRVSTDMATGWIHLLVAYSGNKLELRINGELVDSVFTTFPIHSGETGVDFEIGATHRNGISENLNFEGLIDDIRIYDRVLNENEIQQLAE